MHLLHVISVFIATKEKGDNTMSRIIIEACSSDVAEKSVINLLNGGFVAETARISYNLNQGLPALEEADNYPLILEGKFGYYSMNVLVYSVTAGYGGTGPHAMVHILKVAGFKFDEADILTNKRANYNGQIDLLYKR